MMLATQYQPVTEEAQLDMFLIEATNSLIKSRKIELIFAALSSFSNPHLKKDIINSPSFIESVTLIKRLSPSGKLSLAHALLDQIV
ncbi:hypothetical protein [Aliterella atlantica]|uniref:Uncharacterized protein n=1 Tax=Aliterella atlantica CENA595 TaxID=1618023 RepID=A0A0D8ZRW2_9CYAN|nr:hypothetical protein [Aliterella atlantica]KJH71224.1 hypothetical protein UH38_13085 [Aliterella atlantica CENA595]